MVNAAFAIKTEPDFRSPHFNMPVAQGGQTEGIVFSRVFGITNPDERRFQQFDYGLQ